MRTSLITTILVAVATASCSTRNGNIRPVDVPEAVRATFEQRFPKAMLSKWELEDSTVYEAEFLLKGLDRSAEFNANGDWLRTEVEVSKSELPTTITTLLTERYPGAVIGKCKRFETPSIALAFMIKLKNGERVSELELLPDGTDANAPGQERDDD